MLRHEPVLTYDVDLWIRDEPGNLARCEAALADLDASWGHTEAEWRPVAEQPGWLTRQSVYGLSSPSGAIDIFRKVAGLASWDAAAAQNTVRRNTPAVCLKRERRLLASTG